MLWFFSVLTHSKNWSKKLSYLVCRVTIFCKPSIIAPKSHLHLPFKHAFYFVHSIYHDLNWFQKSALTFRIRNSPWKTHASTTKWQHGFSPKCCWNVRSLSLWNDFNYCESSGVNFTNILRAAFTRADPKSAIKTVNSSSFLHFQDLQA